MQTKEAAAEALEVFAQHKASLDFGDEGQLELVDIPSLADRRVMDWTPRVTLKELHPPPNRKEEVVAEVARAQSVHLGRGPQMDDPIPFCPSHKMRKIVSASSTASAPDIYFCCHCAGYASSTRLPQRSILRKRCEGPSSKKQGQLYRMQLGRHPISSKDAGKVMALLP